ncbi:hypothetical protein BC938DRAFT_476465, partial [Jimgerdemannia flammicorona]
AVLRPLRFGEHSSSMGKVRQDLKSRLKTYENVSFARQQQIHATHATTSTASELSSVNDRLRKLRDEQARAAMNARRHQSTADDPRQFEGQNVRRLRPTPKLGSVSTLLELCAQVVALHPINLAPRSRARFNRTFPRIPVHLKQEILSQCTYIQPITNRRLPAFVDVRYEVLDLENASVSFEALVRAWWRLGPGRENRVVESWEELEDSKLSGDGEGDDDNPVIPPIKAVSITDSEDEDGIPVEIIEILRDNEAHPTNPRPGLALTTPLSVTLRTLNLSFVPHLPSIPLARLLALTLPRLASLSLAGTLQSATGPHALLVLSRGLAQLERWDLGYHLWLRDGVLCGEHAFVNWGRDLGRLRWLNITCHKKASTNRHNSLDALLARSHQPPMSGYTIVWIFFIVAAVSAFAYFVIPKGPNQTLVSWWCFA